LHLGHYLPTMFNMKKYFPALVLISLSLSGCALEDTDGDGIPDVYDTKDDRPGAGELNGINYNGNQFVTPTPSPVASPAPSVSPTPAPTPEILLSPQSLAIPYNTSANLSVLARGNDLTYQWYRGIRGSDDDPVGTDSPLYSTGNLTASANYWVLISNAGGSVPSEAALVTVLDQVPVITSQPEDQDIASGQSATFSVTATGPNLSYQWFFGVSPDPSNPIPDATFPVFTTEPLIESSAYWVRVSNSGATLNSTTVVAFVVDLPEIIFQPDSVTIESGEQATLVVTAISLDTRSYQWYQGAAPDESNLLEGETTDTLVTPNLTTTTSYWVKVTNLAGETFSDTAVVTVQPPPLVAPVIVSQPQSASILLGTSIDLAVSVDSDEDPTLQWFRGLSGDETDPIPGATSTVQPTGALEETTDFWVKVTNSAGSVDSDTATVSVFTP